MVNKRLLNAMQEALDEQLAPEQLDALEAELNADERAAREFDALHDVHQMLRRAPHKRAPERLAVNIMARLAKQMEMQVRAEAMPEVSEQALMLSLALVMLVMMPMLVGTSWLILNVQADPELLTLVIERMLALLVMLLEALAVLLEAAEELVRDNPEAATIAFALIPITLMGLLEYLDPSDIAFYEDDNETE